MRWKRRAKAYHSPAQKYHMYVSMLRRHVLVNRGKMYLSKQSRKTALSPEVELKIANFIRRMDELGFGPTLREVFGLVQEYLTANSIPNRFKDSLPCRIGEQLSSKGTI